MDLTIVTGMSGAGKTAAMIALEDIGYFCVDNVPPQLIEKFVDLQQSSNEHAEKMALVVDSRSFNEGGLFYDTILRLKNNVDYKLVFLDASDGVIFNRYKENRRSHPLSKSGNYSTKDAIEKEREMMERIKNLTDYVIDTSFSNVKELKENIVKIVSGNDKNSMLLQFMSFGFKYGMPMEPDTVFDVRCLPNPFYSPELKKKTGLDKEVRDFVMNSEESKEFYDKILELLKFSVPLYVKEGKTRLVIAFGCTGGKHRSITFAEKMSAEFAKSGHKTLVIHRDKDRSIH